MATPTTQTLQHSMSITSGFVAEVMQLSHLPERLTQRETESETPSWILRRGGRNEKLTDAQKLKLLNCVFRHSSADVAGGDCFVVKMEHLVIIKSHQVFYFIMIRSL